MGFKSFMLGARPSFRYMPGTEKLLGEVRGITPRLGLVGRQAKQLLKRMGKGDDVSSYGELNAINQGAATERRGIEENFMTAGNALLAMNPDNAALINSMRDNQMNRSRERQGMNLVSGLADLRNSATSNYQNAYSAKNNLTLNKYRLLSDINSQQYDDSRKGGALGSILGGVASGLTSFATGGLSSIFKRKPAGGGSYSGKYMREPNGGYLQQTA